MTLAHGGLAKLAEEAGEVLQVVGKLLAYPDGSHPDKAGDLFVRLEMEMGDLIAAIAAVAIIHKLNILYIEDRAENKKQQFLLWNEEP